MLDKNLLSGKKTIVVGGSYGIGRSLAIGFAKLGSDVSVISRSEDKLKEVVERIGENGSKGIYEIADASNYEQLKEAIDKSILKMGGLDILINNAGVSRIKLFHELKPHQVDLMSDINFKGTLYGIHICLPHFLEKKSGAIISTSSVGGLFLYATNILYGATKAAVNYFTRALTVEYPGKNITFNSICPGPVDTPMFNFGLTREDVESRDPILPEELIPYYAFFAANNENGKVINIEAFRGAFRAIYKIPDLENKQFEEIITILEEKLPELNYKEVIGHKALLKFLFDSKVHYYQ